MNQSFLRSSNTANAFFWAIAPPLADIPRRDALGATPQTMFGFAPPLRRLNVYCRGAFVQFGSLRTAGNKYIYAWGPKVRDLDQNHLQFERVEQFRGRRILDRANDRRAKEAGFHAAIAVTGGHDSGPSAGRVTPLVGAQRHE